ncbi:MAG: ABC transporter permease [Bacillota bacterium]
MDNIINLFNSAVVAGTPLLLASVGGVLISKSGQSTLATEGLMYMGGIAGIAGGYYYEQAVLLAGGIPSIFMAGLVSLLLAILAGALGASVFNLLTVTLRTNQTVAGISVTILGTGLANFIGEFLGLQSPTGYFYAGDYAQKAFAAFSLQGLKNLPQSQQTLWAATGKMFVQYSWVVYLAIVISLVMGWILNNTRVGLSLRAVGENPSSADASGISVAKYKYLAALIGGGIIGIGGMYITMVTCSGIWSNDLMGGRGYLAVALVIFATWSSYRAIYASLIVGGLSIMRMYFPIPGFPMQIYDMAPYIVTIMVLIFTSIRQPKERMAPKALDVNFYRENR